MPSNHLILCCPFLLLPLIFPSISVFSNELALHISIGASASASVLLMNIRDWFPLGLTGWISLQSKGLSRVFSNTTVQKHQFFSAQPSLWSSRGGGTREGKVTNQVSSSLSTGASASVLPMNIHGWFPLGMTGVISFRIDWFDFLPVQGTLKNFLQHYISKASILQRSAFFMVHLLRCTWLLEKP